MEVKIPFYNILNMLLTGLVTIGGAVLIYPCKVINFLNNDIIRNLSSGPEVVITICTLAIAYEVGLIVNRIGSVILESFFKRVKWVPFDDDYVLFNNAKKVYPILNTLSREYALSRTGVALFVVLCILALFARQWIIAAIFLAIVGVYFLSCKKHASKIVALMHEVRDNQNKEE